MISTSEVQKNLDQAIMSLRQQSDIWQRPVEPPPPVVPYVTKPAEQAQAVAAPSGSRMHPERFRVLPSLEVDPYRICRAYQVGAAPVTYAIECLLLAGKQGRPATDDVMDAIDALARWLELEAEDAK